jgi:hypothetical protein
MRATSPRTSTECSQPVTEKGQKRAAIAGGQRRALAVMICVNRHDGHETRAKRQRVSLFRRGFWKCNLVVHVLGQRIMCLPTPRPSWHLDSEPRGRRCFQWQRWWRRRPACVFVAAGGLCAFCWGMRTTNGVDGHEKLQRLLSADQRPIEGRYDTVKER